MKTIPYIKVKIRQESFFIAKDSLRYSIDVRAEFYINHRLFYSETSIKYHNITLVIKLEVPIYSVQNL